MEGQIPGLWEDASVEQPKTIFGYGFEQRLGHSDFFQCEFDRRSLLKNIVDFGFGASWILIWAEILKYYSAPENEALYHLQYIWQISLKRSQISHPSRVAQVVGRLWRWLVDCCSGRSSLVDHSSQCPGHTGGGWITFSCETRHLGKPILKSIEIIEIYPWKLFSQNRRKGHEISKNYEDSKVPRCCPMPECLGSRREPGRTYSSNNPATRAGYPEAGGGGLKEVWGRRLPRWLRCFCILITWCLEICMVWRWKTEMEASLRMVWRQQSWLDFRQPP